MTGTFKKKLLGLPRRYKRLLQVATDTVLIWLSIWLAFAFRLGLEDSFLAFKTHSWLLVATPIITIPMNVRFGMYRAVMRYLDREAMIEVAKSITVSALLLSLAVYWFGNEQRGVLPRSFVFNYWVISLITMGGLRLFMRQYFMGNILQTGKYLFFKHEQGSTPVAIYGAGSAGNQLVTVLRMDKAMHPVAFIDDDESLSKRSIAGLKIYHPDHIQKLLKETGAKEILLAVPSASRSRRRDILASLEPYSMRVRTIPGFRDLASGKVKVQDIQEVDIADLLGRDPVAPHLELFERCIKDKVVMVTGAGGSIGSELCRQILASGATTLILFEHSEFNLYQIHTELQERIRHENLKVNLIPILGSIRNLSRLMVVMKTYKVNTVYHAAAYKHVPMVEHNTVEGIRNNVIGTLNAAQAAIANNVQNFVLISTDKAVRPTNLMGSTKRLAEMVLQALSKEPTVHFTDESDVVREYTNNTRFTMVRFGNVLGSSGSVIPLFRKQIQNGGPITVTHPNITRYFMTIPEASQLVIQAGAMGLGGDVFVLDMGEPVKIVELAEKMISLTGLTVRSDDNPNGEIAIEFSGLRPGEKLYEELLIGDNDSPTKHPMIMRADERFLPWNELEQELQKLMNAARTGDCIFIRQLLGELVDGYKPQGDIVDHLFTEKGQLKSV